MRRTQARVPRLRRTAGWLAAAGGAAAALAGCIFLDWSVPAGAGADGGAEAGPCSAAQGCDDQNDCTTDACDPATSTCTHTPLPSGTACTAGGGQVCDGSGVCVGGRVLWARTFKGSPLSSSLGHVSVDPTGDVALAGSLTGAFDLGGGPKLANDGGTSSLGVASFAGDGTYRWSALHGANGATVHEQGSASDTQGSVVVAASFTGSSVDFGLGKIAAAGTSSNLVIAKYAGTGAPFFVRGFAGDTADAGADPSGLSADPLGNAYVVGTFTGGLDLGGGKLATGNRFVASFDPGGAHRWSKSFGESTFIPPTLAVDPAGTVVVTGSFVGALDLGNAKFDLSSTNPAIFLARLGLADGSVTWSKAFMGPASSMGLLQPTAIAVDPEGNILLSGILGGPVSFGGAMLGAPSSFVVKLDSTGKHRWSRAVGSDSAFTGVYVAAAGTDTVLAGTFTNAVDLGDGQFVSTSGKQDIYVARYDAAGALLWKQTFGDAADQSVTGLAVGPDGAIFVAGGDLGAVAFDGKLLPDAGTPGGLFLVKLAP